MWHPGPVRGRLSLPRIACRRALAFVFIFELGVALGHPAVAVAEQEVNSQGKARSKGHIRTASASASGGDPGPVIEATPNTGPAVTRDPEILDKAEMLSLVKRYSADIADALVFGERQREEAIRTKDSIKLACIQDRLASMKSMKLLADERMSATEKPEIRADDLNLRHEFRGVELAHSRIGELRQEMLECAGESLEIKIESTTGGGLPATSSATDPTVSSPDTIKIERPAPASGYQ